MEKFIKRKEESNKVRSTALLFLSQNILEKKNWIFQVRKILILSQKIF